VIRNNEGEPEATAYRLLKAVGVGGRADVADQFIAGLGDEQKSVRWASASGLINAPSSRREAAGFALLDRLEKELEVETDESVYRTILRALAQVASPAHKSRVGALRAALTQDRTSEVETAALLAATTGRKDPKIVAGDLVVAWKTEAASALINILGPEEAIQLFKQLDASKTGERLGIEGAVMALTMFGSGQFNEMDLARRDELRDLFRKYGIGLLSQESREEAERDSRVRTAVVTGLFSVALGPPKHWRQEDLSEVQPALTHALTLESQGSKVGEAIFSMLDWLSRQAGSGSAGP
jgi:hypothetical protein